MDDEITDTDSNTSSLDSTTIPTEGLIFEIQNDLQRAIAEAFKKFVSEYRNDNTITVSDVGFVVRHLGCVPSEEELEEIRLNVVANQDNPDIVKLETFVPYMEKQILALRYKSGTADELMRAFQALGLIGKGYPSADIVRESLRGGESMDDQEITEALRIAHDPDYGGADMSMWIHKLLGTTKMDVYALIPVEESPTSGLTVADWET